MSGSCSAVATGASWLPPWCAPTSLFSSNQSTLLLAHFAFVSLLHCAAGVVRKIFFKKKGRKSNVILILWGERVGGTLPPPKNDLPVPVLTLCPTSSPLQLNPPPPRKALWWPSSLPSLAICPCQHWMYLRKGEKRKGRGAGKEGRHCGGSGGSNGGRAWLSSHMGRRKKKRWPRSWERVRRKLCGNRRREKMKEEQTEWGVLLHISRQISLSPSSLSPSSHLSIPCRLNL